MEIMTNYRTTFWEFCSIITYLPVFTCFGKPSIIYASCAESRQVKIFDK